ncbi:toxin coregulated pilus biosynthesis protein E [mine drainage metagenome]|uniref:Toxin coregulated pilus biosynthesis protein E n=1 Tax=mine drainage metagenome TaxID=410659 RepID=A0A1J5RP51_9ZZZZ
MSLPSIKSLFAKRKKPEGARAAVVVGKKAGWMLPEALAMHLFGFGRKAFYRRIQIMAKARMPFDAAISELRAQAYSARQGVTYAMLDSVYRRMQRGRDLETALEDWLPKEDRMLLSAGDRQGYTGFIEAIDQIMEVTGATKEMIRTMVSGLAEPTVMILSMYGLIAWMAKNFNEKALAATHVSPAKLTGLAHQLYSVGIFATTFWAWLVPLIVACLIGFVMLAMPRFTKPTALRMFLDKLPPWSIYKAITGARWLLSFSTLGQARIPYEVIFRETENMAAPWLRERISAIAQKYERGFPLGEAFLRAGYDFPNKALVDDLVAFGSRPGFEEVLTVIAKEWIVETTRFVKGITVALTGVGYISVFAGMFWIMGAFNSMQVQITAIIQQAH